MAMDMFGRPIPTQAAQTTQDPFMSLLDQQSAVPRDPVDRRSYSSVYRELNPEKEDPFFQAGLAAGQETLGQQSRPRTVAPPKPQDPLMMMSQMASASAVPKIPGLIASGFQPAAGASTAGAGASGAAGSLASPAATTATEQALGIGAAQAAPAGAEVVGTTTSGAPMYSSTAAAGGLPAGPTAAVVLSSLALADAFHSALTKGKTTDKQFGSAVVANPMMAQFVKPVEWAAKAFGVGGKNPRQEQRQRIRGALEQVLPGRQFVGLNGQMRTVEHHELDMNDPLTAQAVAYADPIAEYFANTPEERQDLSAMLARASLEGATSPEEVQQQLLSFIESTGLTADGVYDRIAEKYRKGDGSLDTQRMHVYANNLSTLTKEDSEKLYQRMVASAAVPKGPTASPLQQGNPRLQGRPLPEGVQ